MKMYKIIPSQKKVEAIEYNGTYDEMHLHLKYECLDHCRMNEAGDMVFVNDEGLLDGSEATDGAFWYLHDSGMWQKFVGDALFWGTDGEDNADPSLTIEELRARLCYTAPAGWIETDHTPQVITFDTVDQLMEYIFGDK